MRLQNVRNRHASTTYTDVWNVPNNGEIMRMCCASATQRPFYGKYVLDAGKEVRYSTKMKTKKTVNKAEFHRAGWYHVQNVSATRQRRQNYRFTMYMLSEVAQLLRVAKRTPLYATAITNNGTCLLATGSEDHVTELMMMTEEIAEVRVRRRMLMVQRDVQQRPPMETLQAVCPIRARRRRIMTSMNR